MGDFREHVQVYPRKTTKGSIDPRFGLTANVILPSPLTEKPKCQRFLEVSSLTYVAERISSHGSLRPPNFPSSFFPLTTMTIIHKDIPETQLAVLLGPNVRELATVTVGKPGPHEVLIENVAVAANPKDWKVAEMIYAPRETFVEGNDVAGTIVAVGEGVSEYTVGSRVAALSKMGAKDNKASRLNLQRSIIANLTNSTAPTSNTRWRRRAPLSLFPTSHRMRRQRLSPSQ